MSDRRCSQWQKNKTFLCSVSHLGENDSNQHAYPLDLQYCFCLTFIHAIRKESMEVGIRIGLAGLAMSATFPGTQFA